MLNKNKKVKIFKEFAHFISEYCETKNNCKECLFYLGEGGYRNEKGEYEWIVECKLDLHNIEKYAEDIVNEMNNNKL